MTSIVTFGDLVRLFLWGMGCGAILGFGGLWVCLWLMERKEKRK